MIEYFKYVVTQKYADFEGRARRAEYWNFYLGYVILYVIALAIDSVIGFPILGGLLSLGLLIPGLAAVVRRLHDTDRSGWWLLAAFVPLVNLAVLYFLVSEGTAGPNQYGPDPKGHGDDVTDHLI